MAKNVATCLIGCLLIFSCVQVKKVQQREKLPSAIPVLHIINDTTAAAVKISSLSIDVTVAANIATTTFDIIFYNPNNRILEGEFEFPLSDGQNIVRYGLDIEGKLREGVVVEKAKARVAFENTIRRKVDPGLVEKTKGNNFRTRIYPLPAKGTRHILIAIEQTLEQQQKNLLYQLPLFANEPIDKFSINATVIKSAEQPELDENSLSTLVFKKWENAWIATYEKDNFIANETLAFTIPNSSKNETLVLVENHNGQTYFYVNSRTEPWYKKKSLPSAIALLWDVSASGEKRNIAKEQQLLKEYLAQAGNVTVSLIPFNVFVQGKEEFVINGGNSDALLNRIKEFNYDGGTQFGAIDLSKYNFDEVLLFSDGLSTFGKKEIVLSAAPVITINSSPSADFSHLKYIAQQSHGKFIDLTSLEADVAIAELKNESLQVVRIEYNTSEIEDLVTQTSPVLNKGLSFAGKLKVPVAEIKISLGFGKDVMDTKTFIITRPDSSEYNQVKRIWAGMNIAELDLQFEKNKEGITTLGKEFSIVTQNTSLIVLDRVEDYVEQEILPPAELQKQYFSLLKEKQSAEKNKKEAALADALEAMNKLKDWWNTDFLTRKKNVVSNKFTAPVIVSDQLSLSSGNRVIAADSLTYHFSTSSANNATPPPAQEQLLEMKLEEVHANGFIDNEDEAKQLSDKSSVSAIEVTEWKPDVPYLKELEKVATTEHKSKYFLLKRQYSSQPSFFIDVARFFIEKNETPFGIQVLSNIAEMKLEDASLLRMVANQLLDVGEKELAIETFKDILAIREEEPQSYRDLALAYNEAWKYNEAVELLYKLVLGVWDSRFGDVKEIALNEMNAIIGGHKEAVNISPIDKRLIYAMPVDVRIVISWNTDNSDIDLWITDPLKEKCFYENVQTGIGGKISSDVTQGYGPEEYRLKKALNGNYSIDVNLFGDTRQTLGGPIAIKADLFTDFGKPSQKKKTINFRVTTNKEVINLGSLKFGS
jgi:hypothetical protein